MNKKCLKVIREKKRLSQAEVANMVGITQPTYANIENAKRRPSLPTAQRIARALGCTIDELFGGEEVS